MSFTRERERGTVETKYNAVMVDLETMSTRPDAAIISIGAVKFWLNVSQEAFSADQLFHVVVDLESSQDAGLHIDANTVKWWLEQNKEAQQILLRGMNLDLALRAFNQWFPKDAYIFGNGATFDNVILRNAYDHTKLPYPNTYKYDVCYRTLRMMSDVEMPKFEGTKHNALHDAMAQTKHLMAILEKTPWHGK
jgi:3' exoribonuclease, RNase T-like